MTFEETIAFVFIDVAVIIVVARLMGAAFKRARQPAVVGEIVGGILLGPSLLGAFPGNLDTHLFPTEVRPHLAVIAQLGLIIFMFIVGLELDLELIRGKERVAAVISLSSIALPFALGILLALGIHGTYEEVIPLEGGPKELVDFLPFALFIGASMSITAFPVLARILSDRGMYRTQIGALTLACAAVDDIMAWSLLALVLAVVASTGVWDLPTILVESAAFVAVMMLVVRPQLERLAHAYRRHGRLTPDTLAVIIIGFLVSAYLTSKIGIHAIFGAFTFGAMMPRRETHEMFQEILERLENVSVLLLLPVFFVATGLQVNVSNIDAGGLAVLGLILLAACSGKFVGASLGARSQGIPARKAFAIGTLMNTRGLTELVILNVGREFGVLNADLFTLLVVMAIFTTVVTEPALRLFYPDRLLAKDIAEAQRAALGADDAYRVLVLVDDPGAAPALVDLGADVACSERPSEVVLTRYRPYPEDVELGAGLQAQLAEMASVMDEMRAWAARAEGRGTQAPVFAQFSVDPAGDLLAQADTLDADVLVVAASGPDGEVASDVVTRVLGEAECDVVMTELLRDAPGGPASPVWVMVEDGSHGAAALEVGVRMAKGRGAPLRLAVGGAGGRRGQRLEALAALLAQAGVDCALVAADEPTGDVGAVVVPFSPSTSPLEGGAFPGPRLVVRAREGFDRPDLAQVVRAWQTRPPSVDLAADQEVGT